MRLLCVRMNNRNVLSFPFHSIFGKLLFHPGFRLYYEPMLLGAKLHSRKMPDNPAIPYWRHHVEPALVNPSMSRREFL